MDRKINRFKKDGTPDKRFKNVDSRILWLRIKNALYNQYLDKLKNKLWGNTT